MNRPRQTPKTFVPPRGVAQMLEILGPCLADGGRRYVRLARAVESFLTDSGLPPRWDNLDVTTFVPVRARYRAKAVETCCDLSALMPPLILSGELSPGAATRLWHELLEVCPDDPEAHAYIRVGLEEFGDPDLLDASEPRLLA